VLLQPYTETGPGSRRSPADGRRDNDRVALPRGRPPRAASAGDALDAQPGAVVGLPGCVAAAGPMRKRRTGTHSFALVFSVLAGCHAPTPLEQRAVLLKALRTCRAAIPESVASSYEPPCVKRDLTALNGISRTDLLAALGPPTFCHGTNEGGFPRGTDCPRRWWPMWSFYRLAGVVNGGSPEL